MKKGRNRFSNYGYPQQFPMADNQPVKSHIKVELNAFSNPVPHKMMQISSYLYDFLLENGNQDIIEEFELQPFHLNVLSLERTFFEKVLALNRFSYLGIEPLIGKLRHFFDLHQLYNKTYLKDCIFNDENLEILDMVRKDDERLKTFHGDWLGKPLASSPLFTSLEETWKKIAPQYFQDLEMLTWGLNLPSSEQILKVMGLIKSFLEKYDERSKLLESDKPINSMAETTG